MVAPASGENQHVGFKDCFSAVIAIFFSKNSPPRDISPTGCRLWACGHHGRAMVAIGHIMGPPRAFVIMTGANGTKLCPGGHHRRATVAIGHVMGPPQVFVMTTGANGTKLHPCGHHRRAVVAIRLCHGSSLSLCVHLQPQCHPFLPTWLLHKPMGGTSGANPRPRWPHHGPSPSLCVDNGYQWGQTTSLWPPH